MPGGSIRDSVVSVATAIDSARVLRANAVHNARQARGAGGLSANSNDWFALVMESIFINFPSGSVPFSVLVVLIFGAFLGEIMSRSGLWAELWLGHPTSHIPKVDRWRNHRECPTFMEMLNRAMLESLQLPAVCGDFTTSEWDYHCIRIQAPVR